MTRRLNQKQKQKQKQKQAQTGRQPSQVGLSREYELGAGELTFTSRPRSRADYSHCTSG